LEKMLKFMSGVSGPPEGEEEQRRITSTLHALDHATRFAETASGEAAFTTTKGGPEDVGAAELCAEAIQCVASVAGEVPADPADIGRASPIEARRNRTGSTEAERRSLRPSPLRLEEAANALGRFGSPIAARRWARSRPES
jgi:phosphate:Na+ symporter